jgi:hypothetical protein
MPNKTEIESIFEKGFKELPDKLGKSLGPMFAGYEKGNITIHELLAGIPSSLTATMLSLVYDALRKLEDRIIALESEGRPKP